MALSAAQKTKIVFLLGYPAKIIDATSVHYEKILADRLNNLTAETEALVTGRLTGIEAVETRISAAPARFMAEQVDAIKLNADEIEKLRKERKILTRELGQLLDIPMRGGGSSISVVV